MFGYDAVEAKGKRKAAVAQARAEDGELDQTNRDKLITATRDLCRNFSLAGWAVRRHLDYVSTFSFQAKTGDAALDSLLEELVGDLAGSATVAEHVDWYNPETGTTTSAGTNFSLGGEMWGTMQAVQTVTGSYAIKFNGRDVGDNYDLNILSVGSGSTYDIYASGATGLSGIAQLAGFEAGSFGEIQDAADGSWAGAEIRTQSAAQASLDALDAAIVKKDKIRADLGALQNRLENTMTNLSIQAENLQASESRISDVDVATEMTEFTRNNILAQAATSMLAQANSLAQLALSLLR